MIRTIYSFVFFKLMGWKIKGDVPELKKYLIIVAPHTSNWDFVIGVFARSILRFNSYYLAKKELFMFPFSYFFKYMGGFPVDRKKNENFVDSLVSAIEMKDSFVVTLTPEGTRSYSENWKTGFYHIAKKANIPVVRVAFDYEHKQVVIADPIYMTEDLETTIAQLKKYYSQFKGKNAKKGVKWEE